MQPSPLTASVALVSSLYNLRQPKQRVPLQAQQDRAGYVTFICSWWHIGSSRKELPRFELLSFSQVKGVSQRARVVFMLLAICSVPLFR